MNNNFNQLISICKKELKEGFKRYWHNQHQVPISFKDGTWIGYDDPDSVKNKVKI